MRAYIYIPSRRTLACDRDGITRACKHYNEYSGSF